MSDANTLSSFPFFHHVLRSGTKGERRWEGTVAALLLVVSALPLAALANTVLAASAHGEGVPVATICR